LTLFRHLSQKRLGKILLDVPGTGSEYNIEINFGKLGTNLNRAELWHLLLAVPNQGRAAGLFACLFVCCLFHHFNTPSTTSALARRHSVKQNHNTGPPESKRGRATGRGLLVNNTAAYCLQKNADNGQRYPSRRPARNATGSNEQRTKNKEKCDKNQSSVRP